MAHYDSDRERPDRILGLEVPGDTNADDIVDRTGEQMPRQAHDEGDEDRRSTRVNDEDQDPVRRDGDAVDENRRHDNPRTGRISDW